MIPDARLRELAEQVARRLLAAGKRLTTAESCTGGWLAKALTDLPGSSRWFECGYVSYSNAAKVRDLRVSERTLERHGAVSEPTAREMAVGALRRVGADIAVSITGIAGPDGGTAEKPVGLVWFGMAVRRGTDSVIEARSAHFDGERDAVRRGAVKFALDWLAAIQVSESSSTG